MNVLSLAELLLMKIDSFWTHFHWQINFFLLLTSHEYTSFKYKLNTVSDDLFGTQISKLSLWGLSNNTVYLEINKIELYYYDLDYCGSYIAHTFGVP